MARASATGVEGNTRLTSVTGMVLLVMLAVEGATILQIRQLITLHVYLGLLLLGPVLLKSLSTMYRFARYYSGSEPYVEKGPPHPVLRVLGPLVIATSVALLGTGVGLVFESGRGGLLLTAHKVSFFAWAAVMTVHVLGHLQEAIVSSAREIRRGPLASGRGLRFLLVVVSLAGGVAVASLLYPSASSWTSHPDRRPAFGAPQSHG
ncbi:hypothetical protein acdb102_12210 [Acidothermaceae bacterium B102]|nr:hypothetical protein acdb102_12210 [Acidothermaceae bacterium B102]